MHIEWIHYINSVDLFSVEDIYVCSNRQFNIVSMAIKILPSSFYFNLDADLTMLH